MTLSRLKGHVKNLLIKKGWYEYIKYSSFFYLYQLLFANDKITQHRREVDFYESFLEPCELIFDIGAYDGHKTAAFLNISKKVICCEPDKQSFNTLKIRFRNKRERVFVENVALSDHQGAGTLFIHHKGSAFNTMDDRWKNVLEADNLHKWDEKIIFSSTDTKVKLTTLDALIKKFGTPDFIKIDAEGSEKRILLGLTQKARLISFECLLPEFKQDLFECINRVEYLCADSTYNIAINEHLIYSDFISRSRLLEWIETTDINHFEIVAKMD